MPIPEMLFHSLLSPGLIASDKAGALHLLAIIAGSYGQRNLQVYFTRDERKRTCEE